MYAAKTAFALAVGRDCRERLGIRERLWEWKASSRTAARVEEGTKITGWTMNFNYRSRRIWFENRKFENRAHSFWKRTLESNVWNPKSFGVQRNIKLGIFNKTAVTSLSACYRAANFLEFVCDVLLLSSYSNGSNWRRLPGRKRTATLLQGYCQTTMRPLGKKLNDFCSQTLKCKIFESKYHCGISLFVILFGQSLKGNMDELKKAWEFRRGWRMAVDFNEERLY